MSDRRLRPARRLSARRGAKLTAAVLSVLVVAGTASCTDDGSSGARGGQVVGTGDRYEAVIRRTTDGVPHIRGATVRDVAFGQGYASGQDRTCDLIDQVIKIRGERARWMGAGDGDANVDSDVAWRSIGIFDRASKDWQRFPKSGRELVAAFAAGWNANLAATGVDHVSDWCRGAEWLRPVRPVEVYAYARSVALLASSGALAKYIPSAHPPGTPDPAAESGSAAGSTTTSTSTTGSATTSTSTTGSATTGSATTARSTSVRTSGAEGPVNGTHGSGPVTGSDADALAAAREAPIASNGWAVGSERSADGHGLLVGNPHFPWEGELRFWESQLTVPGTLDIYGVQLSGLPGIGIGFTKDFGWTHTVSAGNRFTAYRLTLVPGSPTSYRYGDQVREMTPVKHTIQVREADGSLRDLERTTWRSHYGPIIDFPGFGWTDSATITYRDANIDNDEFLQQYLETMRAKTLDDLQRITRKVNGVPLFNTIAASADGRAWYADTAATPNLSKEAIAAYEASVATDPVVKAAADNGAVLLDGSDPKFEWVDAPGARDPGLVPPDRQPQIERRDYVFNANDSFWLANPHQLIEGDYSPLHGPQATARSPRTRENAVVLDDTSADGPSGPDGRFTLEEIADASLRNEGFTARALRAEVVTRCRNAPGPIAVPELPADKDAPALPAATVDIVAACNVLGSWNGRYDLDSAGAALWRELMSRYKAKDLTEAGALWREPFDPARPVETPDGLAPAPDSGPDPLLQNLASAVQALQAAGFSPAVPLGDAQFALRNGTRVPIHGGAPVDGTTNVVTAGQNSSSSDPAIVAAKRERLVPGSSLSRVDGQVGYPVTYGTSFLFAVHLGGGAPRAKAFLTYSDTGDRHATDYTAATERFSRKDWRDVAFTETAIEHDQVGRTVTVRG